MRPLPNMLFMMDNVSVDAHHEDVELIKPHCNICIPLGPYVLHVYNILNADLKDRLSGIPITEPIGLGQMYLPRYRYTVSMDNCICCLTLDGIPVDHCTVVTMLQLDVHII